MKKSKNEKIVYTYGVFDLFHGGHIDLLKEAKALGNKLVVGLFADKVAESFKRRPIMNLKQRLKIMRHIVFVDEVVVQSEFQPDKNILKLKPHILAKGPGAGWEKDSDKIPGAVAAKKVNCEIVKLNYHPGISTGEIIKIIKQSK